MAHLSRLLLALPGTSSRLLYIRYLAWGKLAPLVLLEHLAVQAQPAQQDRHLPLLALPDLPEQQAHLVLPDLLDRQELPGRQVQLVRIPQ